MYGDREACLHHWLETWTLELDWAKNIKWTATLPHLLVRMMELLPNSMHTVRPNPAPIVASFHVMKQMWFVPFKNSSLVAELVAVQQRICDCISSGTWQWKWIEWSLHHTARWRLDIKRLGYLFLKLLEFSLGILRFDSVLCGVRANYQTATIAFLETEFSIPFFLLHEVCENRFPWRWRTPAVCCYFLPCLLGKYLLLLLEN